MSRPPVARKPRASSQSRIAGILAAARELLSEQGVASLSIYSVAERAQIPPSSVYHFFASVPALLEALTADIHAAFRACLQEPVEHASLRDWRDLSRLVRHFPLPQLPEDVDVFALAMELGDRVYARSVQLHGEITPRMAEEGMRVFDAYIGLYLPTHLPKRNHAQAD